MMRFSVALLCYCITVLLSLVMPIVLGIVASKKDIFHIRFGHFFLGVGSFLLCVVAFYLVLSKHLSAEGKVTDYFNTVFYRVTVISLLALVALVLLWLIGMFAYAKRQSFASNFSFFIGFGYVGSFALGVYSLFQTVLMIVNYCTMTLHHFDTSAESFVFLQKDGLNSSSVFVFKPIELHISFAITLLSILFIFVAFATFLNRIVIKKIRISVSIASFIGLIVIIIALIDALIYMKQFGIAHYVLAGIALLCDALAAAILFVTNTKKEREDIVYQRQFE